MTDYGARFEPGDVAVGDYAWGQGGWLPHPVIGVDEQAITLGIRRHAEGWRTTDTVRWEEISGVLPAGGPPHADIALAVTAAAERVRRGYLDRQQRDALAALLRVAGLFTLPTPITATLFTAVTALSRPPRDREAGS